MTGAFESTPQLGIETFDLASATLRFFRSSLRTGRELTGCDCGYEKSEQRDPVISGSDRERAERRQEEEVEKQHREDRGEQRGQASPTSRNEEDIQQQRE